MSATVALGLFFVYAALMGVTLSFIFIAYNIGSIVAAFVSASGMFGAAAVYGAVTKRSLASIGGYAFMGLIGIVIASVVNIFLRSDGVGWIISIAGIGIFVVLTAWDVQKISRGQFAAATGSMEKGAVLGALSLYLDFINIFLFLLRLMGGRR
jgi:FtsH-binding integral membrane protein